MYSPQGQLTINSSYCMPSDKDFDAPMCITVFLMTLQPSPFNGIVRYYLDVDSDLVHCVCVGIAIQAKDGNFFDR